MNSYDGKKDSAMRLLYLMKYPSKACQIDPFDDDDDDIDDGKNEASKEEKKKNWELDGTKISARWL